MGNPVAVAVFAHARPDRSAEVKRILLSFAERARREDGCIEYHIHQDATDPDLFVFYEVWQSRAHMNAHLAQPYLAEFMDTRMRYLEKDVDAHVLDMESAHPSLAEPDAESAEASEVLHIPTEGGPTVWFGEAVYSFKATKESSRGKLTLAEASVPPGNGPPPHTHSAVDEAFYIVSGRVEFLSGERTFIAGPGDFVYIPKGILHRFQNVGTHVAKLLFMFVPGAMDEYFTSIGIPAKPGEAPPPLTAEQLQRISDLAPYHGLTIAPRA
jgi:quinol monooxygenase YgiN/quercetin dioxygenase-like cupin family protein